MTTGIQTFQDAFGNRASGGYLVHPGDLRLEAEEIDHQGSKKAGVPVSTSLFSG